MCKEDSQLCMRVESNQINEGSIREVTCGDFVLEKRCGLSINSIVHVGKARPQTRGLCPVWSEQDRSNDAILIVSAMNNDQFVKPRTSMTSMCR